MLCDIGVEKEEIVKAVTQICINYQLRKIQKTRTKDKIISIPAHDVFKIIYIDICGPLKRIIHEKQYILDIIDKFSRYMKVG